PIAPRGGVFDGRPLPNVRIAELAPFLFIAALQRDARQGVAAPAHHVDIRTGIEILGIGTLLQGEAPGRRFGGGEALRVGQEANQRPSHSILEVEAVHLAHAEQRHRPTFRRLANAADALELTGALVVTTAAIRTYQVRTLRRSPGRRCCCRLRCGYGLRRRLRAKRPPGAEPKEENDR